MSVVTLVLSLSAILTSILSATIGMAGGTVLLSILLFYFIPSTAIPLHAVNQLVANAQRSWLLREHVNRRFFWAFCAGALLGNFASAWLLKETIGFTHAPLLIALLIGYSLFKPKTKFNLKPYRVGFFIAGVVLGFIGMFVGATGLILASLFVREDMTKEEIMATQGAIQSFSHGLKVLGFLWIGFDFIPWLVPLGFMSLATILGTHLGVAVFRRLPAGVFRMLYQAALFFSAVYLVVTWVREVLLR